MTGIDGAGKSTLVGELAERLRASGATVVVSTIWDPIYDPHFAGQTLFSHPREADPYLALLDPISRMHFMSHALQTSLVRAMAQDPDVVLLNAYWYKYFATETAHGGDPSVLRKITCSFPTPEATICISLPVAEAAKRKSAYSRYETGFGPQRSREAFEAFQRPVAAVMDELALEFGWTTLSGEQRLEELVDQALSHLGRIGLGPAGTPRV